ncbi:MAG: mismatch repair protein MutL [Kosmotogales bacterium]|nr:mismatch repair protein MutL [Kosmotogales bacterium]
MKIKRLSQNVISKIAAGEVVTGGYSIVKELIENSIDAGSSKISIEIKNGGKEYIKVKDNGSGMSPDELKLAILPHTTSKIEKIKDLDSISTFGFRGEALHTITSVCRSKISSVEEGSEVGLSLELSGMNIQRESSFSGTSGTSIEIFDLLFNTPARRKFLKSSMMEGRMITEVVQRFSLCYPQIEFEYIKDGQKVYNFVKAVDRKERILRIFPILNEEDLIQIDDFGSKLSVKGYISLPRTSRGNRVGEMFFVNNRYVKQNSLNNALERGYGEMLNKGRFPIAILMIEIDPEQVDVNIHPQKLEVKFSNNAEINEFIKKAVRTSLKGSGGFNLDISHNTFNKTISTDELERLSDRKEVYPEKTFKADNSHYVNNQKTGDKYNGFQNSFSSIEMERKIFRPFKEEKINFTGTYDFIGVFGERYILIQFEKNLLIVDQHAAHERILYEKFKENKTIESQKLLLPLSIKMEDFELELAKDKINRINEIGFGIDFDKKDIIINAIPVIISERYTEETFREVIEELRFEGIEESEKIFKNIIETLACKNAIKTGDVLKEDQARELIDEIFEKNLLVCPHGRPIYMKITFKDLDRFFSR